MRYCYSVRTNGEGWFRMHPPMHALYHLPNLGSHPTRRPDLKPTPWLTWRLRPDANRACGCPLLGQIAAAICRCHFGQVCTPPTHPPPQTLRFPRPDTLIPHHLHHMACVMSVVIAVKSTVVVKAALFELHVHAILHSYMLMTCGLLHAIHAFAHA